jgi:redox-sensitive bicupin YhaK (pirin superfamily)
MTILKLDRGIQRGSREGGFEVEILYPGLPLKNNDSGIGAIGRIDRARVRGGQIIKMHPHRDDEILTYIRSGRMLHRDTVGDQQELSMTRLMFMNAGKEFQHEEKMLGSEPVRALQIFLRPSAAGLEPKVQFHELDDALSNDRWRLIVAPGGGSLKVRATASIYDAHLSAGMTLDLPDETWPGSVRLLYVFAGVARVANQTVKDGESICLSEGVGPLKVVSEADSDLVLFATSTNAPVYKGGMFSGNVLAS